MAEIRDLLSRLKRTGSVENEAQSQPYQQPTVSSPLFSPSPSGPQPHHASNIISPNTSAMNTPRPESIAPSRGNDLLSLLKFKQSVGPTDVSPLSSTDNLPTFGARPSSQGRALVSGDAVPGFARKPSSITSRTSSFATPATMSHPELRAEASSSTANPQDYLLKLLNQAKSPIASTENVGPKPADVALPSVEAIAPEVGADSLAQDAMDAAAEHTSMSPSATMYKSNSPMRVFGEPSPDASAFEPAKVNKAGKVFTYVNPFEQLSASSPRSQTPQKTEGKRTVNAHPITSEKDQDRGVKSISHGKLHNELGNDRAAPAFTAATSTSHIESVKEKVDEVRESVSKEVEQVLSQMTTGLNGDGTTHLPSVSEVQQAAKELKEELKDPETRDRLEAGLPKVAAEAFETTIGAIAGDELSKKSLQDAIEESWEDEPVAESNNATRVFNFPMRPFIAISIAKFDEPARAIAANVITEIARIKKDFDQIDRTLVSATQNHIVYPLKSGGFRVISQETGSHKQVFASTHERIFNVSIGRSFKSTESEIETFLGTGVNGSILWTSLSNFPKDTYYSENYEDRGFVFPPTPPHDENSSGGQLKTRVKPSYRNPEMFAYGRGKFIYMIYPNVARHRSYTDASTLICNSQAYLKDHHSVISTKKAGKDFAFSADDTVIVSLDKAGALKFWDIRRFLDAEHYSKVDPRSSEEVKVPIMTLATSLPDEKSWPTSVVFLDKEKPMTKGIALRYLLVGFKQNHTLQLWDLTLGKPVEEINFPHESESDAICSVAYHAKSGILAVGHPTRNSVYLLHVSAPRYNLSPMSQQKYMNMLATKDKSVPQPESTIIVSGCREFSLGDKGELRSLEILSEPLSTSVDDSTPLFELYIMHSKGITNVAVNREILGWSKEGKIINPVDAEKAGMIKITPLAQPPVVSAGASEVASANGEAAPAPKPAKTSSEQPAKPAKEKKTAQPVASPVAVAKALDNDPIVANGEEKSEKTEKKKGKKKAAEAPVITAPVARSPVPSPQRKPLDRSATPSKATDSEAAPPWAKELFASGNPSNLTSDDARSSVGDIQKTMTSEFSNLYRRIAEDRRVQDAANSAKQDAVLRLVSTSLTDNIEPVMGRIMTEALNKMVAGPLRDVVVQTIDKNLQQVFNQTMKTVVPKQIEMSLPIALSQAMQNPGLLRAITEQVAMKLSQHVDTHFSTSLRDNIVPSFTALASTAALNATGDVERRLNEQLRVAEVQRGQDVAQIDQLLKQTSALQDLVTSMAAQQEELKSAISALVQMQSQPSKAAADAQPPASLVEQPVSPPKPVEKTPEEIESDNIKQLLHTEQYEAATIQWLQSNRQAALFDETFVFLDPEMLSLMSPLVILSVCAAVTYAFDNHVAERLTWLDVALKLVQPRDEFVDVFPRIMDIITSRLQKAYMDLATEDMSNPVLRRISALARQTSELRGMAAASTSGAVSGLI